MFYNIYSGEKIRVVLHNLTIGCVSVAFSPQMNISGRFLVKKNTNNKLRFGDVVLLLYF